MIDFERIVIVNCLAVVVVVAPMMVEDRRTICVINLMNVWQFCNYSYMYSSPMPPALCLPLDVPPPRCASPSLCPVPPPLSPVPPPQYLPCLSLSHVCAPPCIYLPQLCLPAPCAFPLCGAPPAVPPPAGLPCCASPAPPSPCSGAGRLACGAWLGAPGRPRAPTALSLALPRVPLRALLGAAGGLQCGPEPLRSPALRGGLGHCLRLHLPPHLGGLRCSVSRPWGTRGL